jgi:hypothetical protein
MRAESLPPNEDIHIASRGGLGTMAFRAGEQPVIGGQRLVEHARASDSDQLFLVRRSPTSQSHHKVIKQRSKGQGRNARYVPRDHDHYA